MINNTFLKTTLYGLTSFNTLNILKTDDWKSEWFISVHGVGNDKFEFEYFIPETQRHWKNSTIKAYADSIEEAKELLLIAMHQSESWDDIKEVRKLYNKLKGRKTKSPKFKLWLEFEAGDPGNWDIENKFCNIHVDLEDGRHYGLNVWTYKFLERAINYSKESGENLADLYEIPPDLFVKELTRKCIEKVIKNLLKIDDLERVLNPSVYFPNHIRSEI
ncbi:hypothetical protein [Emticicia fontis]